MHELSRVTGHRLLARGHVAAVLSSAGALQAASSAAAALAATRILGPEDRGLMVLGITIGSVFGLIGGLGTGSAFRSWFLTREGGAELRRLASAYTWCSVAGVLPAAVLAVAVTALSGSLIDGVLSSTTFLFATATFTIAQALLTQIIDAWFADGRFRRGSLAAAGISFGGLVGMLGGLAISPSAPSAVLGQAVGLIVVGAIEVLALIRAGIISLARPLAPDMLALLQRGMPALGLTVGLAVALRGDRYVLGAVAGAATVGIYSLAATLGEIPRMLPAALGQLFLRDSSLGHGGERLARTGWFAVVAAAIAALVVGVAGWFLIVPVFGAAFAPARDLLVVLVAAEVCFAPYAVASRGLLGGGWTKTACALGIGGSIGAVACYVVGASVGGAMGVAAGCVIIYSTLSLVSWRLLRRRTGRE